MTKSKRFNRKGRNNQTGISNTVHKNRRRQGNRNVTTVSTLPSIVRKNIMSSHRSLTIKVTLGISSTNLSSAINFNGSGQPYTNINTILASSQPFTDAVTDFLYFKIVGIKMDVQRILAESQISSAYSGGSLPVLFMGFFPTFTSSSPPIGSLTQSSQSVQIDSIVTTRQRCMFSFPPIFTYNQQSNAVGTTFMYGMWNSTLASANLPGEIALDASNAGAAIASKTLYSVEVYIDCEFAGDLNR